MDERTRFKCAVCGKVTAGRRVRIAWNKGQMVDGKLSYRYNTDFRYPRRHNLNGEPCPGNNIEAERITQP